MAQNSLYSAMSVNGALVAKFGRDKGFRLFESHPKLVYRAWLEKRMANTDFARWYSKLPCKPDDHEADAFVAAWCASRGYFDDWSVNLYEDAGEDLFFPVGVAAYPWPEPIFQ